MTFLLTCLALTTSMHSYTILLFPLLAPVSSPAQPYLDSAAGAGIDVKALFEAHICQHQVLPALEAHINTWTVQPVQA